MTQVRSVTHRQRSKSWHRFSFSPDPAGWPLTCPSVRMVWGRPWTASPGTEMPLLWEVTAMTKPCHYSKARTWVTPGFSTHPGVLSTYFLQTHPSSRKSALIASCSLNWLRSSSVPLPSSSPESEDTPQ